MYLIDGHNLIPHVRGLSLAAIDDEMQLIEQLQVFCRVKRRKVEVFFDQAPPGYSGTRGFGQVRAHFVRQGNTADHAIAGRLARLKKAARNWTVVSSDRQVQASARALQAAVLSSAEFAGLLAAALEQGAQPSTGKPGPALSHKEVEEWLRLFGEAGGKPDEK